MVRSLRKNGLSAISALVLIGAMLFCACGKKWEQMSPGEIYEYGSKEFSDKSYNDAIEAYEALIDLYPFSLYVTKAELGIADSYYAKKRWDEAIPAFEDFILRHPTNEKTPHAIHHLGMCYYKKKLAIDRDQAATRRAEANFQRLITQFPESSYYADSRERLNQVRKDLAKRERYVAKFYFREKEYYASLRRFQRVVRDFPDTEYFEEALYYSGVCYHELGEDNDARQQFYLLMKKYPEGRYAKKARRLLEEIE